MNAKSPKILVVDDDAASLILMRTVLSNENYLDVSLFLDPKKAQVSYHSIEYDVLIVDLRMPVLSGFDILQDLQKSHGSKSSIIVITANAEDGTETRALELGARKVIQKPFYIPDFIHELKAAVTEMAA